MTVKGTCSNADFSVEKTKGCLYDVIEFSAPGFPSGSVYEWTVGSNTFTRQTPTTVHDFINTGIFDVTLNVHLPNGSTCTVTKPNHIEIHPRPDPPEFTISDRKLCDRNQSVTVNPQNQPGIFKWEWVIGQHSFENFNHNIVTHQFNTSGYKEITLRLTNQHGCTRTKTEDSAIVVYEKPDVALEPGSFSGCAPKNVRFKPDVTISGVPFTISNDTWSFSSGVSPVKDGNEITGQFANAGEYNAYYTIEGSNSCTYNYAFNSLVKLGSEVNLEYEAIKPNTCSGNSSGVRIIEPDPIPGKIYWDITGPQNMSGNGSSRTFPMGFHINGEYDVNVKHDWNGCITEKSKSNFINVSSVSASFTSEPRCSCEPPLFVDYKSTSIAHNSSIETYEWIFYDVDNTIFARSSQKDTVIEYLQEGTYDTRLKVISDAGCYDTEDKEEVAFIKKLEAKLSSDPTTEISGQLTGCINTPITFTGPQLPYCEEIINQYEWVFYDRDGTTILETSDKKNPGITYNDTGYYDVMLKVEDEQGCFDSVRLNDYIRIVNVEFENKEYETDYVCTGELYTLTSPDTKTPLKSATWKFYHLESQEKLSAFADFEFEDVAFIKFNKPGYYNAKIFVTSEAGCIDSFTVDSMIAVSDINANINVLDNEGCPPFNVKLEANVTGNVDLASVKDTIYYHWRTIPSTGADILNPHSDTTTVVIDGHGYFNIELYVGNSSGCIDSNSMENGIISGVVSEFSLPNRSCEGITLDVENTSFLGPKKFFWEVPEDVNLLSDPADENAKIHFPLAGTYDIALTAENEDGCENRKERTIIIEPFSADFSSPDTEGLCSPGFVTFNTEPVNADSFYWHFGDGTFFATGRTSFQHVYSLRDLEEYRNKFDVKMVYFSPYGCKDSVFKEEYISVYGPIARMEMEDLAGCDPHTVKFQDRSKEATQVYFNYGDGSELDTVRNRAYTYHTSDKTVPFETFSPHLIATDEHGCNDAFFPDEDVHVYNLPIPDFTNDLDTGCAPFRVQFKETGMLGSKFSWDFGNDGKINAEGSEVEYVFDDGIHDVRLIVENQYGCKKELIREQLIVSYETPEAALTVDGEIHCFEDTVFFFDQSVSKYPIVDYLWKFNDPGKPGKISREKNPKHHYSKWGVYDITLIVTNDKGCKDTTHLIDFITIQDTIPPENKGIKFVSVENRGVASYWYPSDDPIFDFYTLAREDLEQPRAKSSVRNETTFIDYTTQTEDTRYCYKLNITDKCGYVSEWSNFHCQVVLNAEFYDSTSNKLTWSPYKGWDAVKQYNIYREDQVGNMFLLDQVPGSQTSYIDRGLCNINYCYKVSAVHPEKGYESFSNVSCNKPPYRFPDITPYLIRATVHNDESVLLEWDPVEYENFKKYEVFRVNKADVRQTTFDTEDNSFIDTDVDVHSRSYRYKVLHHDICGNTSALSNTGQSIHLTTHIDEEDRARLNWNEYELWPNGVSEYISEWQATTDSFVIDEELLPETTHTISEKPIEEVRGVHCFRITAGEQGGREAQSVSNISCSHMPSRIFVPNAFSPNDDKLNDVFEVVAIAIHNNTGDPKLDFEMQIYSRWGELLFVSDDYHIGWDGKVDGSYINEDVYVYQIRAVGYDGVKYELNGTFTLIR